MADPEQKYSSNESLDRIYRLLKGEATSEAPESLTPPKRSENESLSMIAELLAGTLEGSQAVAPVGMNSYGMIFADNSVSSGSALASGTWVYVGLPTGTELQNVTEAHNDVTGHLLTVSKDGHYLLGYNLEFAGTIGAEYEFAIYTNAVVMNQSRSYLTLRASGTYHSVSGAMIDEQTANYPNGLIVRTSTHNANFAVRTGQMWIKSI